MRRAQPLAHSRRGSRRVSDVNAIGRARLNELMRRLADGDRSAIEPIYACLSPLVHSFCQRALGELDAPDAAQHALVKLFERSSSFDRRGDGLSWALSIAAWECRTAQKRRARLRETGLEEASGQAADSKLPDVALADAELEAAATAVLGCLSDLDRRTMRLSLDDAAPQDVPPTTFRKRRERAIARLREAWRRIYG